MNAPLKIVALGDSITNALAGYNSYRRDLWNKLIQAGYDVDFVGSKNNAQGNNPFPDSTFDPDHEGHAGWRIDEIVNGRGGNAGRSGGLAGYTPDIALVHLGTNDALQRNTAESSANELKQTIDILRQDNPDIVIFLAQVIPTARSVGANNRINELNALIPGVVADKTTARSPVILVDQNTGFNAVTDTYDELHPNEAGEAKLAQIWFEALQAYLPAPGTLPPNPITDPDPVDPDPIDPDPVDPDPDPTTPNAAPRANRDIVELAEGTQVVVDVLANDRDPDGDTLTLVSVDPGQNGAADIVNGEVLYAANAGGVGRDVVRYFVSDVRGDISKGLQKLTVNASDGPLLPTNTVPVAVADAAMTTQGNAVEIAVLENDSDADGNTLTVLSVENGGQGTTAIVGDRVIYAPNSGFTGTDTFTYAVSDGQGGTATATVQIEVKPLPTIGDTDRVVDGLLSLYSFDEGSGDTVFDVSGVGDPLDLKIDDLTGIRWGEGVLNIDSPSLIASEQVADKLTNSIASTQAMTLEAWIAPANTSQTGPARIATLSANASNRNFTLGQDGDDYNVRLRTTFTGVNGARRSLSSSTGAATTDFTHVVYTRDATGDVSLYIDNALVSSRNIAGTLDNWETGYRFALGDELNGRRSWLGSLDLVAVYSQAFDAAEVEQNFLAGTSLI